MIYLVASSQRVDLQTIRETSPETWRQVRRYNLPVQLALAAAHDVVSFSQNVATAALISLAPCHPGSADLYSWGHVVTAGMANGTLGNLRMNPTQTLHAVDNLAMSAFAITYGNRAYCLGLGGAAGQAWSGLEAVEDRLTYGHEEEALIIAGDQDGATEQAKGLGLAILFSVRARTYANLGRTVRLVGIERGLQTRIEQATPHAARGLSNLISAVANHRDRILKFSVPAEDTDGVSSVTISLEICDG
jgi:hypothetical protein